MSTETLPDALRAAAHRSVELGSARRNSGGVVDPLRALIPGNGNATPEIIAAVTVVTGDFKHRKPPMGEAVNVAPAARARMRRWALAERSR